MPEPIWDKGPVLPLQARQEREEWRVGRKIMKSTKAEKSWKYKLKIIFAAFFAANWT
jgi:hypothetical protein